jgi:ferritin-like protein
MGELGRTLPQKPEAGIIQRLTTAYADEWFAHYNFQFSAIALRGSRAPSLAAYLSRKSRAAFERANRLASRLLELGENPPSKMTELEKHASDKPFKLPASLNDADGILRAVLDAERTSLRSYQTLHDLCSHDPLTRALALAYLGESVKGEEELEKLLGDSAPEMRGT